MSQDLGNGDPHMDLCSFEILRTDRGPTSHLLFMLTSKHPWQRISFDSHEYDSLDESARKQ